ncbi:MAG: uroporphyrinogen decarboxylase family protein [Spirochaetia bacterium]|jgi:uroporphyrinogen decarboxylase
MNSRERVLLTLKGKKADRVPFVDVVDKRMQQTVMGRADFDQLDLVREMQIDALLYEAYPPFFAETKVSNSNRELITAGLIRTRQDLRKARMPRLDRQYIGEMEKFVAKYHSTEYALYYRTRMGCAGVLNSMGLDSFSYALADDARLVADLMDIYVEWVSELLDKSQDIGFDFVWFSDDLAFKSGPMFSPEVFRDIFLPKMRMVRNHVRLPWVYHSDGNLMPILDELLSLGMNGLNPIEPGAMDIELMKEKYGDRLCLIGNINLHHTLTVGTPVEVESEVRERISKIGKNGGYIIASSNSITDYCRPENVLALRDAIIKYRDYEI